MATPDTGDWRELFEVALFEPNRIKLRQRIARATHAINSGLDALVKDQNDKTLSEHIALRDALSTLAELHKLVVARKVNASISGHNGRAAG